MNKKIIFSGILFIITHLCSHLNAQQCDTLYPQEGYRYTHHEEKALCIQTELSHEELKELSFLKDWNLTIQEFFMQEYKEEKELFGKFHQIVIETFEKSDLRGMREIYTDNNEMVKETLSSHQMIKLNRILNEKFCFDLRKVEQDNADRRKQIIERGFIENDDEYRLFHNRIEEIYADPKKADEMETLNQLMIDYYERK